MEAEGELWDKRVIEIRQKRDGDSCLDNVNEVSKVR